MKQKINIKHHLLFWIFYTLAFSLSEGGYGVSLTKILWFELLAFPFKCFTVYFNWLVLVPRLFDYKKLYKYLIAVGILIVGLALLKYLLLGPGLL